MFDNDLLETAKRSQIIKNSLEANSQKYYMLFSSYYLGKLDYFPKKEKKRRLKVTGF